MAAAVIVTSASIGPPKPRLPPLPVTSSGVPLAIAAVTTSTASRSSLGARVSMASKPWKVREGGLTIVNMHFAKLRAPPQSRENFAGIETMIGIEGTLHALLLFKVGFAEHGGHKIALFHTD